MGHPKLDPFVSRSSSSWREFRQFFSIKLVRNTKVYIYVKYTIYCFRPHVFLITLWNFQPTIPFHVEKKLANVHEAMFSLVAPRELLTVTSGYGVSYIFYTEGFLIEGCVGSAFHQMAMLCSLQYDILLRLYGLRRDVLFSLIEPECDQCFVV
jgi:hypothetical protein